MRGADTQLSSSLHVSSPCAWTGLGELRPLPSLFQVTLLAHLTKCPVPPPAGLCRRTPPPRTPTRLPCTLCEVPTPSRARMHRYAWVHTAVWEGVIPPGRSSFGPATLCQLSLFSPQQGTYYTQPLYAAPPHVIHHTTVVQPNGMPATVYPAPIPPPRGNGVTMGMVAGTTMAMSAGKSLFLRCLSYGVP